MRPDVYDWNPEMHSKKVVFPAPFGPISPTISPSRTSIETWLTAETPPNVTWTPSAESTTAVFVRDGGRGTRAGAFVERGASDGCRPAAFLITLGVAPCAPPV